MTLDSLKVREATPSSICEDCPPQIPPPVNAPTESPNGYPTTSVPFCWRRAKKQLDAISVTASLPFSSFF